MKFKVTKLEAAENEIKALEPAQQELLKRSNIVVGVVFVKKTQKTPKEKIKLAETRLKEV